MSDEIEFRVPAADTKGQTSRQQFRCPPAMARMIEEIMQSHKFPYRVKGDLLRHAALRHVEWLMGQGAVVSMSGQVDAIMEVMRDDELNSDFVSVFDRLDKRIKSHQEEGDTKEAVRLVLVVQRHISQMPDGYWKTRYRERMMKQYGGLLAAAKKAQMNSIEEDE